MYGNSLQINPLFLKTATHIKKMLETSSINIIKVKYIMKRKNRYIVKNKFLIQVDLD